MSEAQKAAEKGKKAFSLLIDQLQVKTVRGGKVTAVNGNTCTVQLEHGLELYKVSLTPKATTKKIKITPSIGSEVYVAIVENIKTEAFIIGYSDIDFLEIEIGTAKFRVKESKIKIEAEGENLKTVANDFIDEVSKIIVLYGRGPNVAALNLIKTRLNKILE